MIREGQLANRLPADKEVGVVLRWCGVACLRLRADRPRFLAAGVAAHCHLHHRICAGNKNETGTICGTNSRYMPSIAVSPESSDLNAIHAQDGDIIILIYASLSSRCVLDGNCKRWSQYSGRNGCVGDFLLVGRIEPVELVAPAPLHQSLKIDKPTTWRIIALPSYLGIFNQQLESISTRNTFRQSNCDDEWFVWRQSWAGNHDRGLRSLHSRHVHGVMAGAQYQSILISTWPSMPGAK